MAAQVLIVAEHDGAKLNPSTAKAVNCARGIAGAEIVVAVFASKPEAVATQAAQLSGVTRVLTIENPATEHPLAAVLTPQVVALAKDYTHVLVASTTFGKDLMPRVAVLMPVRDAAPTVRAAYESATDAKRTASLASSTPCAGWGTCCVRLPDVFAAAP